MSGLAFPAKRPTLSWADIFSWATALMGVSTSFVSMSSNRILWDGLKLLVLGSIIETGRRIFQWIVDRFRLPYKGWSISAEFQPGNISFEWLVNYLMEENVWQTPHKIRIKPKNTQRKWKVKTSTENDEVDYVPDYGTVQFFRWKGYWLEASRSQDERARQAPYTGEYEPKRRTRHTRASLSLSIYTLDMSVLFAFVEECRLKYAENTSDVTVYSADPDRRHFGRGGDWTNVKMKRRRPIDSLLLDEGVVTSLLADAREFLALEDWYIKAGIPHRRGYLLHGPPGTGKTSTIYTVAGELGLEIYALSLSSKWMDDTWLASLVSLLPPRGILLIEDIDCAFSSRDDLDDEDDFKPWLPPSLQTKSRVTMSGLLNILDGIGSEEGKIFFATTNHIDSLDPALIRPGRIDRKIEYRLASQKQAQALFLRFFPVSRFTTSSRNLDAKDSQDMNKFAEEFALSIPEDGFSMAELQGYLLDWKMTPVEAVHGVRAWVDREQEARQEKEAREQQRKERIAAAKAQERRRVYDPVIAGVKKAMAPGHKLRRRHRHRDFDPSASSPGQQLPKADALDSEVSKESSGQDDTVHVPDASHDVANGVHDGLERPTADIVVA